MGLHPPSFLLLIALTWDEVQYIDASREPQVRVSRCFMEEHKYSSADLLLFLYLHARESVVPWPAHCYIPWCCLLIFVSTFLCSSSIQIQDHRINVFLFLEPATSFWQSELMVALNQTVLLPLYSIWIPEAMQIANFLCHFSSINFARSATLKMGFLYFAVLFK